MKCKLCGCKSSNSYKTKNGKICSDCFENLPVLLKESLPKLTINELKDLLNVFKGRQFCEQLINVEQRAWFSNQQIALFDEYILFSDALIHVKDIQRVDLTFLPRTECDSCCFGDVCFIIELKYKHFKFRTLFMRSKLKVKIDQKKLYVRYTKEIESAKAYLEQGIIDGNFKRVKAFHKEKMKKEQNKQKTVKAPDSIRDALTLFQLSYPYPISVLKKRYKEMILKCHPDQLVKDPTLKAEDVNRYYELLKQYATI